MATYGLKLEGIANIDATPVVRENPNDVAVVQNGAVSEMREGPEVLTADSTLEVTAPAVTPLNPM